MVPVDLDNARDDLNLRVGGCGEAHQSDREQAADLHASIIATQRRRGLSVQNDAYEFFGR
jgi:hypothetical protein